MLPLTAALVPASYGVAAALHAPEQIKGLALGVGFVLAAGLIEWLLKESP